MAKKPTCEELKQRAKQLEKKVRNHYTSQYRFASFAEKKRGG
jgi:hypothetical protein